MHRIFTVIELRLTADTIYVIINAPKPQHYFKKYYEIKSLYVFIIRWQGLIETYKLKFELDVIEIPRCLVIAAKTLKSQRCTHP